MSFVRNGFLNNSFPFTVYLLYYCSLFLHPFSVLRISIVLSALYTVLNVVYECTRCNCIQRLFIHYSAVLHCLYYIVHTHSSQTKWSFCEFNSATWWTRRQIVISLRCILWQLRCGRNPCDFPRSCRSHLDRPPKLKWVLGSLNPYCWMCSSHICPACRGTNCKNIYRKWHCFDW